MSGFQSFSIRPATPADSEALYALGRRFLEGTRYGALFCATPESLARLVGVVFAFGDNATILLTVDSDDRPFGMLVAFVAPHPIDGLLYCDEVVWWVNPDARGMRAGPKLLAAAEEWARGKNCSMLKMVAPIGSTVGRFYERLGYRAVETAHVKVL